jgi:hypothetical protein
MLEKGSLSTIRKLAMWTSIYPRRAITATLSSEGSNLFLSTNLFHVCRCIKQQDVMLCGDVTMDRYLKLFNATGKVANDFCNNQKRKYFRLQYTSTEI